jgi:transcription antitermination protein NusB
MPSSPPSEGAAGSRPLPTRVREWVFKLYYAHLFTAKPAAGLTFDARVAFVLSDEEWANAALLSPYVDDPRAGRIPLEVWRELAEPVREVLEGLVEERLAVEGVIARSSPRWRVERMPRVDRALLSVGTYELLWRHAAPAKRVINRTVELAKLYGESESRRFVNGILDQIRRDHAIAPD